MLKRITPYFVITRRVLLALSPKLLCCTINVTVLILKVRDTPNGHEVEGEHGLLPFEEGDQVMDTKPTRNTDIGLYLLFLCVCVLLCRTRLCERYIIRHSSFENFFRDS